MDRRSRSGSVDRRSVGLCGTLHPTNLVGESGERKTAMGIERKGKSWLENRQEGETKLNKNYPLTFNSPTKLGEEEAEGVKEACLGQPT